jgi:hypothetical protein
MGISSGQSWLSLQAENREAKANNIYMYLGMFT